MLFKMCKLTNKVTFVAGFGLGLLVHYCATSMEHVTVINGREKGESLCKIKEVNPALLNDLKPYEVFLDNLTGDFY